jgi:hypothetical protein
LPAGALWIAHLKLFAPSVHAKIVRDVASIDERYDEGAGL